MQLVNAIFVIGIVTFTVITHFALRVQHQATDELVRVTEAEQFAEDADRQQDALRGDLYAALLSPTATTADSEAFARTWRAEAERLRADLNHEVKLDLPDRVQRDIGDARQRAEQFLVRAEELLERARLERTSVFNQLPDFEERFEELGVTFLNLNTSLAGEIDVATDLASTARRDADLLILTAAVIIVAVTVLLSWTITYSIRRSVYHVSELAHALAEGELDRRYDKESADEIGEIGRSLNVLAAGLQDTLEKMRSDSKRDQFNKQLAEAFEAADSEGDIGQVVSLAMASISRDLPMEVLVTNGAQRGFQHTAQHPVAGSPACNVESPARCVAIRRGTGVMYPDSESLNACPYLRGRGDGPLSAICIPLSFMGESLGVLHAAGSVETRLSGDQVIDLKTLAFQLSNRTGTVRAFERTQLLASTDSMTGLLNRRALEMGVSQLCRDGHEFTVVLADLDHFKQLNDKHGHEKGDSALVLFAEVLKASIRAGDLVARWGGEEFVAVLRDAGAARGLEWASRVGKRLADRCAQRNDISFTASFGISDSLMWPEFSGLLRIADAALYMAKQEGRDRARIGVADSALEATTPDQEDMQALGWETSAALPERSGTDCP